jgi:hypothetical protein
VACFVSGIKFSVAAAFKGVTDLMKGDGLWDIKSSVSGLLKTQGKIEILGAERIKNGVESAELLKKSCPDHHGTTAGNAFCGPIVLAAVDLSIPHRSGPTQPELDAASSRIV